MEKKTMAAFGIAAGDDSALRIAAGSRSHRRSHRRAGRMWERLPASIFAARCRSHRSRRLSGGDAEAFPASSFQLPAFNRQLQTEIWEKRGFAGLRVIGQLHNTYILCEAEDGLVLIDQHAAHERVLYEQLGRGGKMASQALLVPETVDLGFREAQALETLLPALREVGLEAEPFGGNTVVVKSVPAMLAGRELRPLIVEIAEAAAAAGAAGAFDALDRCRQIAACHGAIRARQALSIEQMQALLRQMDECANSLPLPPRPADVAALRCRGDREGVQTNGVNRRSRTKEVASKIPPTPFAKEGVRGCRLSPPSQKEGRGDFVRCTENAGSLELSVRNPLIPEAKNFLDLKRPPD